MEEADLIIDVDERDIILDGPEADALAVDKDERDFVLDASDSEFTADFGAVGLPGPSTFSLWLAAGNVGTLDDFLAAGGGITAALLETKLALKADVADPDFTGTATFENVNVTGTANINTTILDGGNF